jgi:hypothetical protein
MGEEDEEAPYKAMDELIEVVSCKTSAYYRKLQSGYIQHFLGNFLATSLKLWEYFEVNATTES